MNGGGSVSELCGADRGDVRAVVGQRDRDIGEMPTRRNGGDHRRSHTFADVPPGPACDVLAGPDRVGTPGDQRLLGQIDALVESVASELEVALFDLPGNELVSGYDHVTTAHLEWVDAELCREFVDRALDAERDLAQSVTAESARRNVVGVHSLCVDVLVGAAVEHHGLVAGVEHHPAAVVSVGAGVGQYRHRERGEDSVGARRRRHPHTHRMAARGPGELLGARELVYRGAPRLHEREHHHVFGEQFLLAPETATHPSGVHTDVVAADSEDVTQLGPNQEGDLCAGPHHHPAVIISPGDRAMGFEVGVLDTGRLPRSRDHSAPAVTSLRETGVDVAHRAVDGGDEVAGRIRNPRIGPLLTVHRRCCGIGGHRRIEVGGQHVVLDHDEFGGATGDGDRVGYHCGHPLPDETHRGVEDVSVVGVVVAVVVARGRERHPRIVEVRQNCSYSGHLLGRRGIDGQDAGVRMWTPEHRDVADVVGQSIHRVRLGPGDDAWCGRSRHRATGRWTGISWRHLLGADHAVDGVADRAVSGAPAQVALEAVRQVISLIFVESASGDDHSGGAETALEAGGVDEPLLHRMQVLWRSEPGDRGDLGVHRPERRDETRMVRLAVDQYRAGTAIACVATLLDPELALVAQERS